MVWRRGSRREAWLRWLRILRTDASGRLASGETLLRHRPGVAAWGSLMLVLRGEGRSLWPEAPLCGRVAVAGSPSVEGAGTRCGPSFSSRTHHGCFWMFPVGELPSQGPVFVTEPSSSIVPMGLGGQKVTLSCEARGSPPPRYRYGGSLANSREGQVEGGCGFVCFGVFVPPGETCTTAAGRCAQQTRGLGTGSGPGGSVHFTSGSG